MSEEEGRKKRSNAKDPPRTTTNDVARNSTEERTAARSHTSSSRDEGTRNATESLNQMEQDVLAKSRASAGRVNASVDPPTSVAASNTASRGSVLNQLESEIWAKNQSRAPSGMTSTVGAKAVYSEPSSLTAKRGNSGAKTSAGDAQHTKGFSGPTIATAAVAGFGIDSSGTLLRNLEQEIANKTAREQNRSNQQHQQSSSRLQRMEDEINAKSRSFPKDPAVTDKLRSVEEDILAKHVARESNPSQVQSSKYNADAHEGSGVIEGTRLHDVSPETFNDESDHKKLGYDPDLTHIQDSEGNETTNVSSTSNFNSMGFSGGQMYPDYLGQETAPVMASSDIERGAGIEAFVAEHAVVDATGVAVVLSTEEEEMLERKRMRLYMCIGCLVFVLLAVGIVVAVLLTVGSQKESLKDVPTSAPSEAPSMVPSAAPTSLRFDSWLEALKAVSSEEALADKLSPQYQAALWISDGDKLQLEVGSERGIQRYSLAVFYFSTNGDKWVQCGRLDVTCGGDPNNFSWLLETKNECDWLGVNCDTTNTYVTSIFFPRQYGNGLVGTIPPEILNLSSLEALILHRNQLMGSLPSFLGKLKKLQVLFLLGNKFQGAIPDEIFTGATLLGTIHLGQNMFTGTVPSSLGSLSMRSIRIGENSFTGDIPTELGNLSLLTHLELHSNKFSGRIPKEIFQVTTLTRLRINNNTLSGSIPSEVGKLSNIEELNIGGNAITGTLPTTLFKLSSLINFRCSDAALTGTLSPAIMQLNNTLRSLHLSNNKMSGPLPISAIENMTYLNELILDGNDFTGTITQSICNEKRGGRFFDLYNLTVSPKVDCSVELGCCDFIG